MQLQLHEHDDLTSLLPPILSFAARTMSAVAPTAAW